jgi:hypothetical protein
VILAEATRIIREFVSGWTDQKLAEVLAFAEDGKMEYWDTCGCLIGVATGENLHNRTDCADFLSHYAEYCRIRNASLGIELGYLLLGGSGSSHNSMFEQTIRDQRFIAILREVIADRDRLAQKPTSAPELIRV